MTPSSASAASLIDVDTPAVRTVPSDFAEQDVQTDTQAARRDREEEEEEAQQKEAEQAAAVVAEAEAEAEEAARAEADLARKSQERQDDRQVRDPRHAGGRRARGWLRDLLGLGADGLRGRGSGGALAVANLLAVVGLSGWLGYRGWGLYDRGRLGTREVGIGLGVLGVVGAVEGVLIKCVSFLSFLSLSLYTLYPSWVCLLQWY